MRLGDTGYWLGVEEYRGLLWSECGVPEAIVLWEPLPRGLGLALEEAALASGKPFILVWRQDKSIVIGRLQEWCGEVDCIAARRLGVPIYRRVSGGGSVYHDLGNLNLSLVCPRRLGVDDLYGLGIGLVLALLGLLGFDAGVFNSNDVAVGGWKVSGSSAYSSRRGSLFHATLLVEADLSLLHMLLRPPLWRVERGLVHRVKYRPGNLSSLDPSVVVGRVYGVVSEYYRVLTGGLTRYSIPASLHSRAAAIYEERYGVKGSWRYSPCGS